MSSVSPKKDEVFFATDFLIGIIAQSSGGISFRLFFLFVVFRFGFLKLLSLLAAKMGLESRIKVSMEMTPCSMRVLLML